MCGIAGVAHGGRRLLDDELTKMAQPLERRGPDGVGYFQNDHVALVHRRLSIIDLGGGKQPIFNANKSLAIVCNGELYDFAVHREVLKAKGHVFKTGSDSEVILHLYEEFGEHCLDMMNGMYAFVIVHLDTGELFMARDRFGQKPLFYTKSQNRLAFASGPKSLTCLDWVSKDLNYQALHHYFDFSAIPSPYSIYRDIYKLPAGHCARWKNGQLKTRSYWEYKNQENFKGSFEEAQTKLHHLLKHSVSRRLVADVPVACFLSGGVDSSVIAALGREERKNLMTFSVAFEEEDFDERKYARMVADHLGTQHHSLVVDASDPKYLREILHACEEPFADSSILPTALLSRFTRQKATVALSGDAADELFGGYNRYVAMENMSKFDFLPSSCRRMIRDAASPLFQSEIERSFKGKGKRFLRSLAQDGLDRYLAIFSKGDKSGYTDFFTEQEKITSAEYWQDYYHKSSLNAHELMALDVRTYMHHDILPKVDRASMYHSLEVRSPFLDKEVAEFAMSLPYSYKIKGNQRKRVLREAFRSDLPAEILDRPKMGFGLPMAHWFRNEWKDLIVEKMNESPLLTELLSEEYRKNLLERHFSGQEDMSTFLFTSLALSLWEES